jgi:PAS domain S-box-containing protein
MTPGAIPEAQVRTGDLLQDGESRLRLALAAADLGIWDWDVATGRMVYSQRAKEICGFAQEQDVTFDMAKAVTHPDDYPFTSAQAARALDPEIRDRSPFEYRIVKADGSVCWVRAFGEAVFAEVDGKARAVRYTGTLQDITKEHDAAAQLRELNATLEQRVEARTAELLAAEAARREADALYRAYFENTADPLFVIGVEPDGGFLIEQINPAHEATFGFQLADVQGKRIDELMPPDIADQVLGYYRRCVEQGSTLHYRDVFELPDGVLHATRCWCRCAMRAGGSCGWSAARAT